MPPDSGTRRAPEHLVVGHISKAHGTKGELFVWPLTDHPDDVFAVGRQLLIGDEEGLLPADARSVSVESSRPFKRGVLVKFESVDRREDADLLAQQYLLAPTATLAPLDSDEFFYHELLGLAVETVTGQPVGRVREVFEAVPHDLLEVTSDDGRLHLIPFAARVIREIDRAHARLVIDPPDGLLEL